jgi:sugar diacid utilization regulator/GAF domain-containing protein
VNGSLAKQRPLAPSRSALIEGFATELGCLANAVERGYAALCLATDDAFVRTTGASKCTLLSNCGGVWRECDGAGEPLGHRDAVAFSADVACSRVPVVCEFGLFVPIRYGKFAAVLADVRPGKEVESIAACLAVSVGLAIAMLEGKSVAARDGDELDVMQRVSLRILKTHDLAEIMLLITHETRRLLSADICGIMLRLDDDLVMQRCVGNLSADTASLRMQPGQGLAGRVLLEKKACYVNSYVDSNLISGDFMNLARVEMVRSALAAPLISQDAVIGVLEVWRRRTSEFDEQHVQRIVALANLTSLAIENARLSQARQAMVEELATSNRALVERLEIIRSSTTFQSELIRLQLEGKTLAAVASKAAEHVRCSVLILDANLSVEGAFPPRDDVPAALRATLETAARKTKAAPANAVSAEYDGGTLLLRCASAGAETLGFVVLLCRAPSESIELALSQICTATALHLIERRAAGRAQAETLNAVLWDLLEGSEEARGFALARSRDLHIDLQGRLRLYLCKLDGIEKFASAEGWNAQEMSAFRRRIGALHRVVGLANSVKLAGMRGNVVALICCACDPSEAERSGLEWASAIAEQIPGLHAQVGISALCETPMALNASLREARISIEVARQRGPVAAATYEDAGIVGLLLSLRDDADVRKLVRTIFGALMEEKPEAQDRLLGTLSAFFEANCSRAAAAERLGVHEKTIAYRLAKIRDLTGLDFSKHEKRLLADIALRMHGLTSIERTSVPLSASH